MAIVGLSFTLAKEGEKRNIKVHPGHKRADWWSKRHLVTFGRWRRDGQSEASRRTGVWWPGLWVQVNVVAPGAGSRMTMQIMPEEMVSMWKPARRCSIRRCLYSRCCIRCNLFVSDHAGRDGQPAVVATHWLLAIHTTGV